MYGLSDSEFTFLDTNLISPLKKQGAQVYLFGSRATGKQHPYSDIDIFFKSEKSSQSLSILVNQIVIFFEDSHFPYKIDLVNFTQLAECYKDRILSEALKL